MTWDAISCLDAPSPLTPCSSEDLRPTKDQQRDEEPHAQPRGDRQVQVGVSWPNSKALTFYKYPSNMSYAAGALLTWSAWSPTYSGSMRWTMVGTLSHYLPSLLSVIYCMVICRLLRRACCLYSGLFAVHYLLFIGWYRLSPWGWFPQVVWGYCGPGPPRETLTSSLFGSVLLPTSLRNLSQLKCCCSKFKHVHF